MYGYVYWPTPGFKRGIFKLSVLNRWDLNFCVRSSTLRGNEAWQRLLTMVRVWMELVPLTVTIQFYFYFTPIWLPFFSYQQKLVLQFQTFYSYIHTTLSYAHSSMSLFLLKLLIKYTTFPALLKLCTTSKRQQAWNQVWHFNPVVNHSAPPLNH